MSPSRWCGADYCLIRMNDDARVALLAHPCRLIVIGSMLESGRIGEALHDELTRWLAESGQRA